MHEFNNGTILRFFHSDNNTDDDQHERKSNKKLVSEMSEIFTGFFF